MTKQRLPVYFCAALLILGLLGALGTYRREPARQLPLDTWEVDDFVAHLRRQGLEFRVVPNFENSPLQGGAYLTTTDKTRRQLLKLPAVPERIDEWEGTISINRFGRNWTGDSLSWLSDDCYTRLGDFVVFGDPKLRRSLEDALQTPLPSHHHAEEVVVLEQKTAGFHPTFVQPTDGLR